MKLLFVAFILMTAFSCSKEEETVTFDLGLDYFPMEESFYRIYQVDSISIASDLNLNDSAHYQIKEVQDSLYTEEGGELVMRIVRYKRSTELDSWTVVDVWTAQRGDQSAKVVEENVKKMVMIFEPRLNTFWDINIFNTRDEWKASYTKLHESCVVGGTDYDSVCTVSYDANINLIERETGHRSFAKNIGMIESEEIIIRLNDITPVDAEIGWEDIETGMILTYKLIEYGIE